MTAAEFARLANVSKGAVLNWIRTGQLPATQVQTGRGPTYEIDMDAAQALEWLNRAGKAPRTEPPPTAPERANDPAAESALIVQLRGEVSFLRAELQRRGEELRKRGEIDRLKDAFIQELVQGAALPPPGPAEQEPEPPRRRRPWWPFRGRPTA